MYNSTSEVFRRNSKILNKNDLFDVEWYKEWAKTSNFKEE